jgi:hypothetical protein
MDTILFHQPGATLSWQKSGGEKNLFTQRLGTLQSWKICKNWAKCCFACILTLLLAFRLIIMLGFAEYNTGLLFANSFS